MAQSVLGQPDYSTLDKLLKSIEDCGAELDNTLTNHAPMVLEALCAIGRADAAPAWLERYRHHLLPWPQPRRPIDAHEYRSALGDASRLCDWRQFFLETLDREPWREIARTWVSRLVPGLSGAATHGVIRVGHAVRSLSVDDTLIRRRELAAALAYWAASYRTLPRDRRESSALRPSLAIARVPLLPTELRQHRGSIDDALGALAGWPAFADVADLIDVGGAQQPLIDELAVTFADVYVENAHDVLTTIVFVHAVTSIAAVEHLVPLLAEDAARDALLRYLWQAGAALYSVYGTSIGTAAPKGPPAAKNPAALIDNAIASGDEHAIKFAEACLFFDHRRPAPAFAAASAHASRMLSPR